MTRSAGVGARRQELRASLTPAEARLWLHLRNGQLLGRKVRRQHSIGAYILDFYCPAEALAVELDGAAHDHDAAQMRDLRRTEYPRRLNIRVVRFDNRAIMENLEGGLSEIAQHFVR